MGILNARIDVVKVFQSSGRMIIAEGLGLFLDRVEFNSCV